jgi:hypothetical protein
MNYRDIYNQYYAKAGKFTLAFAKCRGDMADASGCCAMMGRMKDGKRGTSEGD